MVVQGLKMLLLFGTLRNQRSDEKEGKRLGWTCSPSLCMDAGSSGAGGGGYVKGILQW